jgi:hypothetical protein
MLTKIFIHVDSFWSVMDGVYSCLVGARTSTTDWNAVTIQSVRDRFLSMYDVFVAETEFQKKCRLLLDLFKLEIVFAGAFFDGYLGPVKSSE